MNTPENPPYSDVFRERRGIFVASALGGVLLALLVSLFQPLEYRSEASILIIPRGVGDGYQASRSAEKYAGTLTSVLPSMSFYNKVVLQDQSIASFYSGTEREIREAWEQSIDGSVKPDTGILHLSVYARRSVDAQRVMTVVIHVLENEGASYLGGNASVLLYTIDRPIVSRFPVRPNYPVNIFGGAFAAVLVAVLAIIAQTEFRRGDVREREDESRPFVAPVPVPAPVELPYEAEPQPQYNDAVQDEVVEDVSKDDDEDVPEPYAPAPMFSPVMEETPDMTSQEKAMEALVRMLPKRRKDEARWMWKQRVAGTDSANGRTE
ncbi:MAG: hypothetical protein HYV34_00680 [Candidatus Kerfeldbacteria bacterium]|nr:hypothetical protein [Candidatus Kerfeldbacteria bacterium]